MPSMRHFHAEASLFLRSTIMHFSARTFVPPMAIAAGMALPAHAADMTGPEIKSFLAGKTAYLETTAASAGGQAGQVVIYWGDDGTALYKTPAGVVMHGKWEVKDNTNCTEWKERPNTGCVRYDKTGDVVTVVDVNSGQVRAKILKTVPGNAEKLGP
jgi:hypothetical protein